MHQTRRTFRIVRCPQCREQGTMLVVFPFWQCPRCGARLIPADDKPIVDLWTNADLTPVHDYSI